MSSADVRVNTSTVLKTEPSFIAAPELARLLDVIAVSTEESKTQVEQIKSIERVREREIITRETSDSKLQQALSSLMSDVAGLKNVYMGLIKTLDGERKLKEQELKDRQDKEKILASEQSEVQKGMQFQASMVKPMRSFMGQEQTAGTEQTQENQKDSGGLLTAAATAGLLDGAVIGSGEFNDGTPGTGGQLKPIHKQALDIISGPESGGDYNAMNNGKAGDRPGGSKKWLGKDLTEMTIGEVKTHQTVKKDLWAAGRYQFVPNTLPGVASSAGLKDSDMFDKNNQDLMAITLVKQRGIQPWTAGGSKYSKEDLAIIEKARSTPLGVASESQATANESKNKPPTTSQSSITNQQSSSKTQTSSTTSSQQTISKTEPSSQQQISASKVEPSSSDQQVASINGQDTNQDMSPEPSRVLTPDLSQSLIETSKDTTKTTASQITPSDAGMQSGGLQLALVQTPIQTSRNDTVPSPVVEQDIKLFSPINPENLFMIQAARELNLA